MPTILVVEDEVALAIILERVLTEAGYQVVHAPDGQAALDVLATLRPDVVVTNVSLPVLDGRTLCHRLAADPRFATIPRVVISGGGTVRTDCRTEPCSCPSPLRWRRCWRAFATCSTHYVRMGSRWLVSLRYDARCGAGGPHPARLWGGVYASGSPSQT